MSGEFFKGMNKCAGFWIGLPDSPETRPSHSRWSRIYRDPGAYTGASFRVCSPGRKPPREAPRAATYASDREPGGPDYSVAQTLRSAHEDRGARGDGRPVAEQDNSWDSTALRLAEGAAHSHQRLPQVHCYVDTETVPRVAVETHSHAFATRTFVLLPVGVVLGTCLGNADLRRRELRRHRMRAMVGR
jgi:hypothetical protein